MDFTDCLNFIRDNPRVLPLLVRAKGVSRDTAILSVGASRGSWWNWEQGVRPNSESATRIVEYFRDEIEEVAIREGLLPSRHVPPSPPTLPVPKADDLIGPVDLVPLLGSIPAGPFTLADCYVERYVPSLAPPGRSEGLFALKLVGDSMNDHNGSGLPDGSIVIFDSRATWKNGDIVAARHDGEVTCKRIFVHGDNVILQPLNPDFDNITLAYRKHVEVLGKAVYQIKPI